MKIAAKQRGVLQPPLALALDNIKRKWRIFALLPGAHFHFIMQRNESVEEENQNGNAAETE